MSFSIPLAEEEDAAVIQAAKERLDQMQHAWKRDIRLIAMLGFLQFVLRCVQLVFIARLLALMVLVRNQHTAVIYLLVLGICSFLQLVITHFNQAVSARFSAKVSAAVRLGILGQMEEELGTNQFQQSIGEAILLLEKQSDAIAPYYYRYLPQRYISMVSPVIVAAAVGYISWICGLIMLLILPMIPLYMIMIGKGTLSASQQEWRLLSAMGGYFYDRLKGLTTLAIFSTAERESAQTIERSNQYSHSALRVLRMAFLSSAAIDFFTTIIIASMAIIIGLGMIGYVGFFPKVSLGDGLVLLILVPEFFASLKKLGLYYHDRAQALGAMMDFQRGGFFRGLSETTLQPPHPAISTKPVLLNVSTLAVSIENLSFGYADNEKLFQHLNLSVNWSESILLEGLNGTGKSTLIDIIHGFKKPDAGSVSLAGMDISFLGMEGISSILGWAGQQSRVLQGTLRYNLCMGRKLTDPEIMEMLTPYFDLKTFLFPYKHGLDTLIQEDGKTISGGERHKLSLARVILKRSPILLLDEPFTYLDDASIARFSDGLSENALHQTIILISHHQQNPRLVNFKKIQLHAAH
jgi:ATP-binding cassette subfamily C protein CydD